MSEAETRRVLIDNKFGEIPNKIPVTFEPKAIVHVILTIDRSDPDLVKFKLLAPAADPPTPDKESIEDYARRVVSPGLVFATKNAPSPYDIPVKKQSWVVVELHPEIKNWQFTTGELGCTTKDAANTRNCSLRHVYPDGLGDVGAVVREDGCRMLYFGVVMRGRKSSEDPNDPGPGSAFFNFHVEFLQKDPHGVESRLKVIFDPDVPNDGDTNAIPPGQ